VTERSQSYRVLQPPALVNQYAAIPSLHVGWNMLVGITIVRCSRHLVVRAVGVLLPMAMAIAVVLSANHYIVAGLLGAMVALVGLVVVQRVHRGPGDRAAGRRGRKHRRVMPPRLPRPQKAPGGALKGHRGRRLHRRQTFESGPDSTPPDRPRGARPGHSDRRQRRAVTNGWCDGLRSTR
jgi:hypothetical protein